MELFTIPEITRIPIFFLTFFLTVLTRLGLKDEIDLPGHDYEKNVWAWYRLTFVNAADPEVMAFAVNVNMAGQYLSYFLFTTSVISVVSLIFGEKSSLVREILTSALGGLGLVVIGSISADNAIELGDETSNRDATYNLGAHNGLAVLGILTGLLYLFDILLRVMLHKKRSEYE